jgi:hypothetical protein
MLLVEGPDTRAAIMRARDHTPGTDPLILEVGITLLLGCPLAQDKNVHTLRQSRPGAESYGLYLSDLREYHFRPTGGHDATSISVYDAYKHGDRDPLAILSTREEIWNFFSNLAVQG